MMLDENIENLSDGSGEKNKKTEDSKKEIVEKKAEPVKEEVKTEDVKTKSEETAEEVKEVKEEDKAQVETEAEAEVKESEVKKEEKDIIEETSEEKKETKAATDQEAVSDEEEPVKEESEETEENEAKDESATESENEEKEKLKPKEEIPQKDYTKLSLEELADEFENLMASFSVRDLKNHFEDIKSNFNKKYSNLVAEKKTEFVKAGGKEEDFTFLEPVKSKFFSLLKEFKRKRQLYYKQIEKEQQENLEMRLELIDRLKDLIDNGNPSSMYKEFRELQNEWRNVGQIPRSKYNDVWQTYHHHVERFYDLLHLNKEFRDLDFKHNFEEKSKLVEKAEKLAESEDIDKAFRELQVLHRMWKEDIGPVAREHREEIWNRFSEATKKIHHKRHLYQKELESKLEENIQKKMDVIDKIKNIAVDEITSHKAWQDAIRQVEKFREEFFSAGKVPSGKSEAIWKLFKEATRDFNRAKNSFYKSIKSEQVENLKKKLNLVEQAESLKDSDDWDTVTDIFKKIQSDWKKIGHVPKKDSDKIWKRFKDACNHYFDRLHERQDDVDKEMIDVLNKKKELLNNLKEKVKEEVEVTMEEINEHITEWRSAGRLPSKMSHIEAKFNKTLEAIYKKLNIDKEEASFLKFKNIVDSYLDQNETRRLDSEQLFVRKKIDELTREIKQLENNVSFISNVSDDNPLVKNVLNNIENYKKELAQWKRKIDYLRRLDY